VVEVHFQKQTGKGGPGSIPPPLVCCARCNVICVVQSTEFPSAEVYFFWKVSVGFSGSFDVVFWKLRKQLPIVCRSRRDLLVSLNPVDDQLTNFFTGAIHHGSVLIHVVAAAPIDAVIIGGKL
jgi:hypothetical protein